MGATINTNALAALVVPVCVLAAMPVKTMAQGAERQRLDEIVVTAQRREEALERTPVAISALGSDALRSFSVRTDADLQFAVPGLTVKAGQNTDQLNYVIRGQSLDAFSGVLPGVMPYFNEVQVAGGGSRALYDLDSVQVLKGPQGTLFGRNSTGGAVLFTSAKPGNEFGGYAAATVGNHGRRRGEGAIDLPFIEDTVLARIAGFYETSDGYQYNRFDDSTLGGMDRTGGRLSLTFLPNDRLSNELVVDFSHLDGTSISNVLYTVYPTGFNDAPVPANFLFTPALDLLLGAGAWDQYVAANPGVDPDGIIAFGAKQRERGPYDATLSSTPFYNSNNLIISNITSYQLSDDLELRGIIGYTRLRFHAGAEFDGSPFVVNERGERGARNDTEQFSSEIQLVGETGNLSYVSGAYFSDEEVDENALSTIVSLEPFIPVTNQINSGLTKRRSYAGYAQGTYDLSEATGVSGLSFTLGGRYTSERVTHEKLPDDVFILNPNPGYTNPQQNTYSEPSWHVGIEKEWDSVFLYLNARSSVRSGGFNFFAPPLPGIGNDGGGEYATERARDVELGVKFMGFLGDAPARLNVAAYNLVVKDAQRVTYAELFGAPAAVTVNVPETTIRGLEVDGSIAPASWFTFGGSVNYTNARFTENEVRVLGGEPTTFGPVPDTPRWTGVAYTDLGMNVSPTLRASLRTEVYAQSELTFSSTAISENPGTTLPGYGLVNMRIELEHQDAGWSLAGVVRNIGDREYYLGGLGFGSIFSYNLAVPGEPRTYQIEARYRF